MKTILILTLFFLTTILRADQSISMQLNGASHHIKPNKDYNEKNYGAGFVYEINRHYISAGFYKNSFNTTSKYIFTGWRHSFRYGNWLWSPGITMGIITGYSKEKVKAIAVPVIAFGYDPVRINLMWLPGINGFQSLWFAQAEIELFIW